MIVAGLCLANGLGALCGPTAPMASIGSSGSSLYSYSGSSSSSGSSAGSSREHSISSVDSILMDLVEHLDHLEDNLPFDVSVPPPQLPANQMTTMPPHVPLVQHVLPMPGLHAGNPVQGPRKQGASRCEQHPAEALRLYCETCSIPLCGMCKGHRSHVVVYIKVAVEASKIAVMKHLNDATSGAQKMRDRLDCSRSMVEAVDARALQVASEVRQVSRRLIAAVEARERELLSQVEKVRLMKSKSLALQAETLRGLLQRFVRLTDSLRDTLQHGEDVEYLHASEKATVELTQLRAARANIGPSSSGAETPMAFEDDEIVFTPPEPVLQMALTSMGCVTSSAYAMNTIAIGAGLTRAVRGRPSAFAVTVKSHLNEQTPSPPELLEALLVAPDGGVIRADVEDRRDGSFLVVYRARTEGPHTLHVTLRGRHIVGSPFPLVVRAVRSYDAVRAPALTFGGEGSEDGSFLRPWGVCCDRQGRLIVADRSNNRVQVFRPDGTFLFKFGSQGSEHGHFDRPAGVAADPQGRIIVADKDNHRVQIFTAEGKFVLAFGEMGSKNGQFNYPWDLDCNSQGQIVVSDTRNHRIQLFSPDGKFLLKYGWEGSASMWRHFDTPRGVAFSADGYVIVTDFNNHRLVVVEPGFRNARFLGSEGSGVKQFQRPQGVAVDADGNIIVADSRNNRLQVFEANGTFRCQVTLEMDRPSGVCVTPDGMIAVIDFGNNRVMLL